MRSAEEDSRLLPPGAFLQDRLQLYYTLDSPGIRNFYGYGHGTPDSFLSIHPIGSCFHRYRFVFLDGCQSYSLNLFSMFGAQPFEIEKQYENLESSEGFLTAIPYANKGLWPAAFMGHLERSATGYIHNPPDIFNGKTLARTVEAVGNWHVQFLYYWMTPNINQALITAKYNADWMAWQNATGSESTGWPKPPANGSMKDPNDPGDGGNMSVRKDPVTGQWIYWDPVHCLKVTGYLYLQFDEFNHAGDFQP